MTTNLNINSRLKEDQLKIKIGQRLKELRTAQGLTIDALREKLSLEVQKAGLDVKGDGVSKSMVSRWENGKSQPSAPYIRAYATLFNVDMNYILGKDLQSTDSTDLGQHTINFEEFHNINDYLQHLIDSNDAKLRKEIRNDLAHEFINTLRRKKASFIFNDDSDIIVKANKNSLEELIVSTLREDLPWATKAMIDKYREVGTILTHLLDNPDTFIRFFLALGQLRQRDKLDSFLNFTIDQFYEQPKDIKMFEISRGLIKQLKSAKENQVGQGGNNEA